MKKRIKIILTLLIPIIILIIISLFCMYSSTLIKDTYKYHFLKQLIWINISIIIFFFLKYIKPITLFKYSKYLYYLSNILLILVLIFGKTINGSKSWFSFSFINIQPSELSKLTLMLYLSNITYNYQQNEYNTISYLLKSLIITLIPSILIFIEPDTGPIPFFLLILFTNLFISKLNKKYLYSILLITLLTIIFLIYLYIYKQEILINILGTSLIYRIERLLNLTDNLQLNNALITIGNAKLLGSGITSNILYVPELPTDFIFTLSISIFGILGGLFILLSYYLIFISLLNIINKEPNIRYKTFTTSLLTILIFETSWNILMNIGILPIMGIPLPFLSYGGSNLIILTIMFGIVINRLNTHKYLK